MSVQTPKKSFLKGKISRFFLVLFFLFFFAFTFRLVQVLAFTSDELNFQGKLTDNNGVNVADGYYDFRVKIYNASTSGTAQVISGSNDFINIADVHVVNGIFNFKFAPLASALTGDGRYLQVCFNSSMSATADGLTGSNDGTSTCGSSSVFDKEFTPRKKLTGNPYSIISKFLGSNKVYGGNDGSLFVKADDTSYTGTGTISCTNGSGSVTGSGTIFTQELAAGSTITFGGNTYTVFGTVSDTILSLHTPCVGTSSGVSYTYKNPYINIKKATSGFNDVFSISSPDSSGNTYFRLGESSNIVQSNVERFNISLGQNVGSSSTAFSIEDAFIGEGIMRADTADGYILFNPEGSFKTGFWTSTPVNTVDIGGNVAIGAFAGINTAPAGGLIVEGDVGIGIASPSNKLDIEGAVAIGASYSGSFTAPTNGLIVQGNVGIGDSSPTALLTVGNGDLFKVNSSGIATTPGLNIGLGAVSSATLFDLTQNQTGPVIGQIKNSSTGDAYSLFTVNGSSTGLNLYSFGSGYSSTGINFASGSTVESVGTGGLSIGAMNASGVLRFYTGNSSTERMRIDASGFLSLNNLGSATNNTAICYNGSLQLASCSGSFLTAEVDGVIGNEVTNVTNASLTRSGSGTSGSPYTLSLNLGNANTWTALQTFNNGLTMGSSSSLTLTSFGTGAVLFTNGSAAVTSNSSSFVWDSTNTRLLVGANSSDIGGGKLITVGGIYTASNSSNSSLIGLDVVGGSFVSLSSGNSGSGTILPLAFHVGGTERGRFDTTGKFGVGVSSNLSGTVDVTGTADTGTLSLQLRGGNSNSNSSSAQITFSYNNTADYRHAIRTRHNAAGNGSGNAIDFYTWKPGDATSTIGGQYVMSIEGPNVGIGTGTGSASSIAPRAQLHIFGAGQATATPTITSTSVNLGGTFIVHDTGGAANSGGLIAFGAGPSTGLGYFAGIKGLLTSASNNFLGDLSFSTRNASTDTTLTERMRILAGGNVSIGVTPSTANSRLQVTDSATSGNLGITIENNQSTTNLNMFRIITDVGSADNVKFRIDSDGDVFTDGATSIGTPADVAENYPVDDTSIQPGEIVSVTSNIQNVNKIDEQGNIISSERISVLSRSNAAYDSKALGIVSSDPGIVLSSFTNGKPIALAGRVPVKVNTSNGNIQAGDLITTSNVAGIGMKATSSGFVIGKALEDYSNSDPNAVGMISIFVNYFYYSTGSTPSPTPAPPTSNNTSYWTLSGNVLSTTYDLTAKNTTVDSLYTQIINVGTGKLSIDANGNLTTSGNIVASVIQSTSATINSLKVDKLSINQNSSAPTVGSGIITAGTQTTVINNTNITVNSKIFVTITSAEGDSLRVIEKIPGTSFTIKLNTLTTTDVTFDYWILGE